MKKTFLWILVLLLAFSLCGCLGEIPTRIENSDFDKVQTLLDETYNLHVPSSAHYIGGYFDNAFRDPCMLIAFTVTPSEFENLFGDGWRESGTADNPTLLENCLSIEAYDADGRYDYDNELYTFLWYDVNNDGDYVCVFQGPHHKI